MKVHEQTCTNIKIAELTCCLLGCDKNLQRFIFSLALFVHQFVQRQLCQTYIRLYVHTFAACNAISFESKPKEVLLMELSQMCSYMGNFTVYILALE